MLGNYIATEENVTYFNLNSNVYSSMAFYHSVHDIVNYASPSDENLIDIVEILPPVNELTDEQDFDDENRDLTLIL
ncbi:Hypothetical predicted protein [Octopus vulgaris]|uniref:Uncharacterized protein n=1 Tax=Octopus vulgaris TaxID=6645 RepID=A0AA36EX60_OCTVU|nr:Hypothetical predicted protein [Octopus vulgaris]